MDFNNIEEYLRSGGTAEKIAQAFTKSLNRAIDNLKKEEEYRKLKTDVVNAWNTFITEYYKKNNLNDKYNLIQFYIIEEDIDKIAEFLVKYIPLLASAAEVFENLPNMSQDSDTIFSEEKLNDMVKNILSSYKDLEK